MNSSNIGFCNIIFPTGDVWPTEAIEYVKVVESVNLLYPTVEFAIRDFSGYTLDYEPINNIFVMFGNSDESDYYMIDVSILSMPESGPFALREQSTQYRTFRGVPSYALAFSNVAKIKGYGFKSASEVFVDTIESEYADLFKAYGGEANITYNTEESIDKKTYIRPGWTGNQWFWYLAKKAINSQGLGGYLCWFDHRKWSKYQRSGESITPIIRANFVSPSFLAAPSNRKKYNIIVSVAPEDAMTAFNHQGKVAEDTMVAFDVFTNFQLSFSSGCYVRTGAWYDVEKEKYDDHKWSYDDFEIPTLGSFYNRGAYDPIALLCGIKGTEKMAGIRMDCDKLYYVGSSDKRNTKAEISCEPHLAWFKRHVSMLTYGNLDLRLGDKVSLRVPQQYDGQHWALAGDWVVSKIVHQITFPTLQYVTKLVLSRDEYLGTPDLGVEK